MTDLQPMPSNAISLVGACLALVLLTFVVGLAMLVTRVREMQAKRLSPQAISTSTTMSARLQNVRPADNFRNLFEVPVLFYALAAIALATGHVPAWLPAGAWLFVGLRAVHSLIHCTYYKVVHRLAVFATSFGVLIALWVAFVVSLTGSSGG